MARKYVCDRCKAEFVTWETTSFELPANHFWGKRMDFELCESCLNSLRKLVTKFMANEVQS
jgi:hypothetical protein